MWCFSGLNLARRADDSLGIPMAFPISGSGDIGFFTPTHSTRFDHDRRFERFHRGDMQRRFAGFLYWHMKYLKSFAGFANYELEKYPQSRYHRRKLKFETTEILTLPALRDRFRNRHGILRRMASMLNAKYRLTVERDHSVLECFPQASLEDAILEQSPEFSALILNINSRC